MGGDNLHRLVQSTEVGRFAIVVESTLTLEAIALCSAKLEELEVLLLVDLRWISL